MSEPNTNCHYCGTKFHHCMNCGTDGYSEDGFCCMECKADFFEHRVESMVSEIAGLRSFEASVRHAMSQLDADWPAWKAMPPAILAFAKRISAAIDRQCGRDVDEGRGDLE